MIERNKKIISFSLYGKDPKYTFGAVENAKLQPKIYPGWKCRFYIHVFTVPENIINKLFEMDCELVFKTEPIITKSYPGMFWRMEVLKDMDVGRFIVRDTDSRLLEREKVCVDEWIISGKNFHIIRDHPHHKARIMGGMWGATKMINDKLNYNKLLDKFKTTLPLRDLNSVRDRGHDQHFLAQMIYPQIKNDVCIHDDYHFFKDEKALKISSEKVNNNFIGEVIDV